MSTKREELDSLEEQVAKLKESAGDEVREQVAALSELKDTAAERLRKLEQAGDDAWDDVREGVDKGWSELKTAVAEAKSKFRGKQDKESGQETPSPSL